MIHPSAVIEDGAQIDPSAEIGPFCYISGHAKIGANNRLIARVTVLGNTTIGEGNVIFPGACLGGGPQDHGNEFQPDARLFIGSNNVIRENVTMHAGTPKGQTSYGGREAEVLTTRVGSNGMFMVNSHIAHDCVVGDNVIMTNNAVIGGHVRLEDGVILGGQAAVHQFCRIGRKAMIGGLTGIGRDVIPFAMVTGDRGNLRGLNLVGLKRSGYDEHLVKSATRAYMFIFKSKEGTFEQRVQEAKTKFADNLMVQEQIAFIEESMHSRRQVLVAE